MMHSQVRRFDGWVRHPTAFSFGALEAALEAAAPPVGGLVADPFVGSGRSATFVAGRGDRFVGIDAHPLMSRLAAAKLTRPGPAADLRAAGRELARQARRAGSDIGCEPELLRRFISPMHLQQLVTMRELNLTADPTWGEHLMWAVIGVLRTVCGVSWPYARPRTKRAPTTPVDQLLMDQVDRMAEDLAVAPRAPDARIIPGDARKASAWRDIAPSSVDACVSSPPYLNNFSYAEATRLELCFLGVATTWRTMTKKVSSRLVASCTQEVSKTRARLARERLAGYPMTSALVMGLEGKLARASAARPRGKPYDDLLASYFADMGEVLRHLYRTMAPGARAAWVIGDSAPYGVFIDTPAVIGELAGELGFVVVDDCHLRERGQRWPSVSGRCGQVLSERLLVFHRPGPPVQLQLPGLESRWQTRAPEAR